MSILSDKHIQTIIYDYQIFKNDWEKIQKNNIPRVIMIYPILNIGAPADQVAPHSIYYMHSILKDLNISEEIFFWDLNINSTDIKFPKGEIYYIHPLFATIEKCSKALKVLKTQKPDAIICMGNSDQHQHEMCLGGLRDKEIAKYLLSMYPDIDAVFLGKNHEYSLVCLILNMILKRPLTHQLGRSLFRYKDELIENIHEKIFALNSFPFLDLPDNYPQMVRLRSSVGCRAVCNYCIESSSNNPMPNYSNWNGMSAKRFVEEITYISSVYGHRFFNIIDSSFEDAEKKGANRLKDILRDLKDRNLGLSLKIHLRSETVVKLSDEEILKLKESGVDILVIGVESGAEDELKKFKKIASANISKQAILKLDKTGLFYTILGYLMFTPFTTLDFLKKKVDFLMELNRCWDYMNMTNWALVYWGSNLHDELKKVNLVLDDANPLFYVNYCFSDQKVGYIAVTMNKLKVIIPEIMIMHKLFYDIANILARKTNSINAHLSFNKDFESKFDMFANKFYDIQKQTGKLYFDVMQNLIYLSEQNEKKDKMIDTAKKILLPVKSNYFSLKEILQVFISLLKNKGLNTENLLVDTWFSNVNFFGVEVGK